MITLKKFLINVLLYLMFVSCTTNRTVNNALDYFGKTFPSIKGYKWKIEGGFEIHGDEYFVLSAVNGDTSVGLHFILPPDNTLSTDPILMMFIKYFDVNDERFLMEFSPKGDTLYYLKRPIESNNPAEYTFFLGKYTYYYRICRLNKKQEMFYETNKDSIIAYKINTIPDL